MFEAHSSHTTLGGKTKRNCITHLSQTTPLPPPPFPKAWLCDPRVPAQRLHSLGRGSCDPIRPHDRKAHPVHDFESQFKSRASSVWMHACLHTWESIKGKLKVFGSDLGWDEIPHTQNTQTHLRRWIQARIKRRRQWNLRKLSNCLTAQIRRDLITIISQ